MIGGGLRSSGGVHCQSCPITRQLHLKTIVAKTTWLGLATWSQEGGSPNSTWDADGIACTLEGNNQHICEILCCARSHLNTTNTTDSKNTGCTDHGRHGAEHETYAIDKKRYDIRKRLCVGRFDKAENAGGRDKLYREMVVGTDVANVGLCYIPPHWERNVRNCVSSSIPHSYVRPDGNVLYSQRWLTYCGKRGNV